MGRIVAQEFVSLDGVFEAPSWTAPYGFTPEMGELVAGWTGSSTALLLGRATWEMFWPSWSTRSAEDDPGVAFFNDSPKHVVSSTMTSADEWNNSSVLGAYDAGRIRSLKDETNGNLYVSGSGTLVRGLLADGLLDELHLLVYPIVLGAGARLFPDGSPQQPLTLITSQSFTNGVTHLAYTGA